jgi:hypothetical protein
MRKGHKSSKRSKKVTKPVVRREQNIDDLLSQLPAAGVTDTACELVEVYEAIERSYRAALMAGEAHPRISQSTNY